MFFICCITRKLVYSSYVVSSVLVSAFTNTQPMVSSSRGPHDVFKSATHLSHERAPSSKHNRDGGCKQMVYKKMWVQSDRSDGACCFSVAIPAVSYGSFHRKVMGFSHG